MTADGTPDNASNGEIRPEQLALLLEVSRTLGATLELPVVLQSAIESAVRLMRLDTGAIYLLTGESLFLGAATPRLPADFPETMRRASLADHPHVARCLEQRAPVCVDDASTADFTPAERAVAESRGLRSTLFAPLIADNQAVGTLILSSCTALRSFSAGDVDLSSALSYTIALAVSNARLYEAQRTSLAELARAYEEAESVKRQLRALANELALAEDRERRHLAVEIHDRVAQPLAMLKMKLEAGVGAYELHQGDESFRFVLELVDEALTETRSVMDEASPPHLYDLGLAAALEWLAERTQAMGVECDVFVERDIEQLDEECALFLFQAARELLANVVKHAGARYASASVWSEGSLACVKVTDDGRGFPTQHAFNASQQQRFGLFSLRERTHHIGGTLEIASALGVGTTATLCVPHSSRAAR